MKVYIKSRIIIVKPKEAVIRNYVYINDIMDGSRPTLNDIICLNVSDIMKKESLASEADHFIIRLER